jgi:hypothetical protein
MQKSPSPIFSKGHYKRTSSPASRPAILEEPSPQTRPQGMISTHHECGRVALSENAAEALECRSVETVCLVCTGHGFDPKERKKEEEGIRISLCVD